MEIALMQSVNCPKVLACIDAFKWQGRVLMVLPLMDCGKLTSCLIDRHINRMGPFSQKSIKYLLYCICVGLNALHQMEILHRDIKSDNVFISSTGKVTLADLGLSVFLTQETTHR